MAVRNGVPDEALGAAYPFEDRYVTLDDGVQMHYIETGKSRMRRPTFLLLHGNPTWSFLYRRFMEPLAKAGRVVAVDHIGYGRSDHPERLEYHRLEQHIANLEEFVAKKGLKRVVPVVQDWGGPIGLGWGTRHPDKLAGLVVMNTWAFTEAVPVRLPAWYKALKAKGIGELLYRRRNMFIESFLPRLIQGPTDGVLDGYRHPFPNAASRAAILGSARMVPDRPDHPDWPTMDAIEKALPDLDVPAAILWACKDPVFGKAQAEAFHRLLPGAAEPEYFEEAGHYLQEDIPEVLVERILAFTRTL